MSRLLIGSFVQVATAPYRELGVGKLTEQTLTTGTVEYCDVPGEESPVVLEVPLTSILTRDLSPQTRVYQLAKDSIHWFVGRVLDGHGDELLIQFPNGDVRNVPCTELATRWRRPITDPTLFLANEITETPMFAESRSAFLQQAINQKRACLGMTAILSSRIQLESYQYEVVRRVLQDPIQRYLLADEVGLGKTIEAALLIRQYVLDYPLTARALVIVPPTLVRQWREELANRALLTEALDNEISVVASDNYQAISTLLDGAGMLVVDEAHHLARHDPRSGNPLYELIEQKTSGISRILFLSATPVLADTESFHRMLHLLDPLVFPLDDLEGFRKRIEARQVIAEVTASLVPENVLILDQEINRLRTLFPEDQELNRLCDQLNTILEKLPHRDDPQFLHALDQLTAHISETYRLHRRILRNRRKSLPWATPTRGGHEPYFYRSPATAKRTAYIDQLRGQLANTLAKPTSSILSALFLAAVHPHGQTSLALTLRDTGITHNSLLLLAKDIDRFAIDEERPVRIRATLDIVKEVLSRLGTQAVIFCDLPDVADEVASALTKSLGRTVVQRHCCESEDLNDTNTREPWTQFLRDPTKCRVLICDRYAEEGLNLHGGKKVVIHFDLPPHPNRIEQRLGRLDRFGTGGVINSIAIQADGDRNEETWRHLLADGFGVFSQSIASLQYLAEEILRELPAIWVEEGTDALNTLTATLSGSNGRVSRELRRIHQQDQFDSLAERDVSAFEGLEDADQRWKEFGSAVRHFATSTLQFRNRKEQLTSPIPEADSAFRVGFSQEAPRETLLPLESFINHFIGCIDFSAPDSSSKSPWSHPYALRRATAISRDGDRLGLRPLRVGDALIDALLDFCATDDRGRAFALYRRLPGYQAFDQSKTDVFFRCDYIIEPCNDILRACLEAKLGEIDSDTVSALRRRAESIFPSEFRRIWMTADGRVIDSMPDYATAKYRHHTAESGIEDFNLNSRRWEDLHQGGSLPWLTQWPELCKIARSRSETFLRNSEEFITLTASALRTVRMRLDTSSSRITSRLSYLTDGLRDRELADWQREQIFYNAIRCSIEEPRVRLDVIGALFLSADNPFKRTEET